MQWYVRICNTVSIKIALYPVSTANIFHMPEKKKCQWRLVTRLHVSKQKSLVIHRINLPERLRTLLCVTVQGRKVFLLWSGLLSEALVCLSKLKPFRHAHTYQSPYKLHPLTMLSVEATSGCDLFCPILGLTGLTQALAVLNSGALLEACERA